VRLVGRELATKERLDAEHCEEGVADKLAPDVLSAAGRLEIGAGTNAFIRSHFGKAPGVLLPIDILRRREGVGGLSALEVPGDLDKTPGVVVRKRLQEDSVGEACDGSRGANPERKRQHPLRP
jgi:hypothetical protein